MRSGFIPRAKIQSARGIAEDILPIRVVGHPARNGRVEDTGVPSINVNRESGLVDSSGVSLDAAVMMSAQIKLENRRRIRTSTCLIAAQHTDFKKTTTLGFLLKGTMNVTRNDVSCWG